MSDALILQALQAHALDRLPPDWPAMLDEVDLVDVRRELSRPQAPFTARRAQVFLSPAARELLEPMAAVAAAVTRQRHGRVMDLYAPLYLSNVCINRCGYCGFNVGHKLARRRLSLDEAAREAGRIAGEGFRDILLVSGEDREHVTLDYLVELVRRLRARFASIAVEIHPQDETGYRRLCAAGVDGVTLYQETYDRDTYARWHPAGPKADYRARLAYPEGAARAGMRRLGLGALLGLADWRYEALCLALHAQALMKHFWRARVSVSFPRLRPAPHVALASIMPLADADLVQMILALRLCFADIGLVLSTREPATLRDHLLPLGITQLSAGSKTNPGGYGEDGAAGEQFAVADTRPVAEVVAYLRAQGYDPVWKDWDAAFLRA